MEEGIAAALVSFQAQIFVQQSVQYLELGSPIDVFVISGI